MLSTKLVSQQECRPVIEMRDISKSFGHVQALDQVDFQLYPAEVLALVGDNGAGKSTLVKVLAGVYQPDAGEIYIGGEPVELRSPSEAQEFGIATVYQNLALVDVFDVSCNIYLGREPLWMGLLIDYRKMFADAVQALDVLRIKIPSLRVNVGDLSGGQRQAVAIARALARGGRVILMDEPTAALGVEQTAKVNEIIAELKANGKTVLVISHNREHVFQVADRLVVLRHGHCVGNRRKEETSREEIVGLITGAIQGDVPDSF